MNGHTTTPDRASPFADTDPNASYSQVAAVLERARKRSAEVMRRAPREPDVYWEEPGLHGSGRRVNLRRPAPRAVPRAAARKESSYATGKLPSLPRFHFSTPQLAVIGAGVVGVSALVWWLWKRGRPAQTIIGEDFCGFDVLGADE